MLTANVAALASAGAISLERVAQDGMRVRADAGAASFRRQASLEHLAEAGELVDDIKKRAATASPAAASLGRRLRAGVPRNSARSASAPRWSNCRRCRRPSGATVKSPSRHAPAPRMPTRG